MKEEPLDRILLRTYFGRGYDDDDDNDDDEGRTKLILISMTSFGELVTLHIRQLTKNLHSLFFGTLCCLFADVLVNSCLCYHGTGIFIHVPEDQKP